MDAEEESETLESVSEGPSFHIVYISLPDENLMLADLTDLACYSTGFELERSGRKLRDEILRFPQKCQSGILPAAALLVFWLVSVVSISTNVVNTNTEKNRPHHPLRLPPARAFRCAAVVRSFRYCQSNLAVTAINFSNGCSFSVQQSRRNVNCASGECVCKHADVQFSNIFII